MRVVVASRYCKHCKQTRAHVHLQPDYMKHIILCFLTAGLWSPVLLATALYNHFGLGWRCEVCSNKN